MFYDVLTKYEVIFSGTLGTIKKNPSRYQTTARIQTLSFKVISGATRTRVSLFEGSRNIVPIRGTKKGESGGGGIPHFYSTEK